MPLAVALLLGHAIWPAAATLTRHEVFLTWARQQGLRLGPVCIAPSTLGGVGVFAERDIALGEMVFAVPKRLHVGLKAALDDPRCGAEFESRVEDGNALGVLCAFLAKEALCSDGAFKPYIDTLDLTVASPDYVQFWTEEEVDLLSGTAAYQIALDVRAEAEDVVRFALSLASLSSCVHQDLSARGLPMDAAVVEERIATCVRRAHAAVLSRSFDDLSDFGAREMIPLLDLLQHGKPPSVQHRTKGSEDFEQTVDWMEWDDGDGGDEWEEAALSEPCLVARTRLPVATGEELFNFYGDHPHFVFAMHYGFVPKVGVHASGPASVHQMGTCVLNLEGVAAKMGRTMGPAIALAAQSRALELSDDWIPWTPDDLNAHDDAYQGGSGMEPAPIEVEDGHTFLAHVLADAALWMRLPKLTFFMCDELIELAISEAEAGRLPSNQYGAAALVVCARLCALDERTLEAVGGQQNDPNEQLEAMFRQLLDSEDGRLSAENDWLAATLLREAARERLAACQDPHGRLSQAMMTAREAGGAPAPREACVRLAREVREVEVLVLERLVHGDVAERMFTTPEMRLNRAAHTQT